MSVKYNYPDTDITIIALNIKRKIKKNQRSIYAIFISNDETRQVRFAFPKSSTVEEIEKILTEGSDKKSGCFFYSSHFVLERTMLRVYNNLFKKGGFDLSELEDSYMYSGDWFEESKTARWELGLRPSEEELED